MSKMPRCPIPKTIIRSFTNAYRALSHLHGHKFQIIGRATDYTSDDASLNPPLVEGQANPVRRDTVHVDSGGSATLRFKTDNPGAWFFHCTLIFSSFA